MIISYLTAIDKYNVRYSTFKHGTKAKCFKTILEALDFALIQIEMLTEIDDDIFLYALKHRHPILDRNTDFIMYNRININIKDYGY